MRGRLRLHRVNMTARVTADEAKHTGTIPPEGGRGLARARPEVHGKQKDDKTPFPWNGFMSSTAARPTGRGGSNKYFEKGTLCPLLHKDRGTIGTERNPEGCLHRTGRGREINVRVTPDKACATSPPGLQASLLGEVRTEEFRATERETGHAERGEVAAPPEFGQYGRGRSCGSPR